MLQHLLNQPSPISAPSRNFLQTVQKMQPQKGGQTQQYGHLKMLQPKDEPLEQQFSLDHMKELYWPLRESFDRDSGIESADASTKHFSDTESDDHPEELSSISMANMLMPPGQRLLAECKWEEPPAEGTNKVAASSSLSPSSAVSLSSLRCVVCGDAASGYHYGVCSCNGCKTFFRRTFIAGRTFVCKHGGNCQFDRDGRCACRACRFQRCVRAGMDEKAIQHIPSANLTLSIARKRFQNEMKRRGGGKKARKGAAHSVVPELLQGGFEAEVLATIGAALRAEEKLNRLRQSSFYPHQQGEQRLPEVVDQASTFGDSDKYTLVQQWPRRPCPGEVSFNQLPSMGIKFWLYMDLYLGMEYLKTLDFFHEMGRAEKVAITKSVVVPNSWLTSASYSINMRSDVVQYPDGLVPFRRKADSISALEEKIMKGAIPALQRLKPDQVQTALIRQILLMDETCDGVSAHSRERIGQTRSKLTRVLLIYLQNRHGAEVGLRHFADSMHFIGTLFRLQQIQRTYFVYRCYVLQNAARVRLFRDFLEPDNPTNN